MPQRMTGWKPVQHGHEMLAQFTDSFWMPTQASSYAGSVDWVFYFILAIAGFFFCLIALLMIVFVVRYHRRPGHREQPSPTHNLGLELTWTIIPLILVVVIFVFGFRGYLDIATVPANAYTVEVIAQKWSWAFRYPNGYVDANLHVPVDRPIQVILTSKDVIHSFFVPAFRVKKDVVPGRFNRAWFQATQINDTEGFDLFCAEYCGTSHSAMVAKVYVHEPTAFARWLDEAGKWEGRISPLQRGQELYKQRGCAQCHSIDGSSNTGPTLKNVWDEIAEGRTAFTDGSKLADRLGPDFSPEDYVRESLYKPQAKIVQGFVPVMPSYEGQIRDNDIPAMVAFLKSLSDKHKGEADTTVGTQPAPVPPAGQAHGQTTTPATQPAGQNGSK